jgi:hypothetical protein
MAELSELRKMLNEFGVRAVELAKSNLQIDRTIDGKKRRRVASGKLRDSLTYRLWKRGKTDVIIFTTNSKATREYADVIEEGRRPNSTPPPIAPILDWIKIKKIRLRNVDSENVMSRSQFKKRATKPKDREDELLLVARRMSISIGKKGIKGIHYFQEAIDDALEEFDETIISSLIQDIEKQLKSDKYIK